MHTEEQARELWCPMTRTHVWQEGQSVSGNEGQGHGCCLASACAMWRWCDDSHMHANEHKRGFCGIAGRPS